MKKILANIDFLLPGLILMIMLAKIFPFQEGYNAYFPMATVNYYGVVLIFLLYGMKLSPKGLIADLSNWKLHVSTQLFTFVFIPIFALVLLPVFNSGLYYNLWLAFFFLTVLPSTVSMSVIFVEKNKGNLGGAIFNSTFAGFAGIIITPLWLSLFISNSGDDSGSFDMIFKMFKQILVPIIAGMIIKRYLPSAAVFSLKWFKNFDKYVILIIVYASFSGAFNQKIFDLIPPQELILLVAGVISIYLTIFELLGFTGRMLKLDRKDQIVLYFCGSQKSLVHGSVFALLIFEDIQMQAFALLPLMIYHAFQLLFASYKSIVWQEKAI